MQQTIIASVAITHFRGISHELLHFGSRSAIIGQNGSGKTHILESIHLSSGGSLHYFQAPRDESYSLELTVLSTVGPKQYSMKRKDGREEYFIQGGKVTGIKYREDLPFRTVFLSPFDMNLLYFAPSMRRDYIDSILSRTFAQFPKLKRDYETVMRQRNALLKKIRDSEAKREDLDFWDRTFAQKANLYSIYRKRFTSFVVEQIPMLHDFLPKYTLRFQYESKIAESEDVEDSVIEYLLQNRERDILTGHTHIGPHLDDFSFQIEVQEAQGVRSDNGYTDATLMLSRGETKMLLLALKQIEVLFLKKQLSLPIILLFDDLYAELDQIHSEQVIDIFDVDQVVVTTQRSLPVSEKWEDFSCIKLNLQ